MSLTSLPLELLENIFFHLDIKDLSTLVETADIEVNDYFWRQICEREGYHRLADKESNWKNIFQRYYNWRSFNFVKRVNKYPIKVEDEVSGNDIKKHLLHGNNLLVNADGNYFHVWNIEKAPQLVQILPSQFLTSSGTKILTKCASSITIYSFCYQKYKEVAKLAHPRKLFSTDYCLTNDFFAVFNNPKNSVKIANLTNFDVYDFDLPNKQPGFTVLISCDILYILASSDSRYLLTRYNMANKQILGDLTLFNGASMTSLPKVKISTNLITACVQNLETQEMTVKIWNTDQPELLKSLPSSWIDNHYILWMILEDHYLIFSNSIQKMMIWHSLEPDVCQEIKKERDFLNCQKTISNSLLILSYDDKHCFSVIDYKKATYLYEVNLDRNLVVNGVSYLVSTSELFSNDHFYVILQKYCVVDNATGEGSSDSSYATGEGSSDSSYATREGSSDSLYATGEGSSDSSSLVPPRFKKNCFIFVYDFRGKAQPS